VAPALPSGRPAVTGEGAGLLLTFAAL